MRRGAFTVFVVGILGLAVAGAAHAQMATDFRSPPEAAQKIGAFSLQLRQRGDRRSLFPGVYSLTIARTEKAIWAAEFYNPHWVRRLILNYANIYRRTIWREMHGQRRSLPRAWQLEFDYVDTADQWIPDLDLVYGINVHIARDLVEALLATPTDYQSATVEEDFLHITDILRDSMPEIWSLFESYGRAIGLPPCLEQSVMMRWIANLRQGAWDNAKAIAARSRTQQDSFVRQLDAVIERRAREHGVLLPTR